MRLRDVIDVDDLPLDRRARNFAFTSHLDYVASDVGSHLPGARRRVGRPAASDRADLTTSVTRAEQELKGFSQVAAQPVETVQVELAIPASRCTLVTAESCTVVEPGVFELRVGPSSRRSHQLAATFRIRD